MIISENNKASQKLFENLLFRMNNLLNHDATNRPEYYEKRGGNKLEEDVYGAVCECSKGTEFHNTISLVSKQSFPDIVVNKFYGIEVKSTEKDQWKSTGSSILESTRIEGVERIYLTFGKLAKPVEFITKPYEACMSGIAVTHYPRYLINMKLNTGETIFDKMGISYDEMRKMENPAVPVAKYYKKQLKTGETLWWTGEAEEKIVTPPTLRLWSNLSQQEKENYITKGYVLYPEIFGNSSSKYNRFAVWLALNEGILNTCVRDTFSAGGQVHMTNSKGEKLRFPAVYGRINKYKEYVKEAIETFDNEMLSESWNVKITNNKVRQWCELVAKYGSRNIIDEYNKYLDILFLIFKVQ